MTCCCCSSSCIKHLPSTRHELGDCLTEDVLQLLRCQLLQAAQQELMEGTYHAVYTTEEYITTKTLPNTLLKWSDTNKSYIKLHLENSPPKIYSIFSPDAFHIGTISEQSLEKIENGLCIMHII